MTKEQAVAMLKELDLYASGVDRYEYGLPVIMDEHISDMLAIVEKHTGKFFESETFLVEDGHGRTYRVPVVK